MNSQDAPNVKETPMCSELRCKGMYIPKSGAADDEFLIPGDTTHWWCERTQRSIGPDQDWVHKSVCTPGRECYRKPGDPA